MSTDLYKLADSVETEEDFIRFIDVLMKDKIDEEGKEATTESNRWGTGPNGWENSSLTGFLESAHAWANVSINGFDGYRKPTNPWRRAAQILHAGKFYE